MAKKKKRRRIPFKELPKEIKTRKIITWIVSVIAVASLGYFGFYCMQAKDTQESYEHLSDLKDTDFVLYNSAHVTVDDLDTPDILEDYVTLYNNNKSLIGWIKIDYTLIDYPVMQSQNEDYYLNHNFNQKKDNNGSIFIDPDCSIWPRSENIIIYGHNMKSGKMFGQLKKYKSESFYQNHQLIQFDTLYEKGTYQIMYVFNEVVHDEVEVAFKYYQFIDSNSLEEFESNMADMAEKSLYDTGVTAKWSDDLITLSTCDYTEGAERFVIVAKRID